MFYGEYTHGIDNKSRLIMPSRIREVAKENGVEKFFLTRGLEKCIFMFAEGEWRLQEQRFKNLSFTKEQARHFNRLFFSGAVEVVPDRQGRFIIPGYLKEFAGIKKESIVIGVSNRLEIWEPKAWKEIFSRTSVDYEKTAEGMLDIS